MNTTKKQLLEFIEKKAKQKYLLWELGKFDQKIIIH